MSETRESSEPPVSVAAPDRDKGWRPADDDDSARAVAWRARRAHLGVKEIRAEHTEFRAAITSLSANVGSLTGAVDGVKKLLRWALGIVGALALVGAARLFWDWLSTLHH